MTDLSDRGAAPGTSSGKPAAFESSNRDRQLLEPQPAESNWNNVPLAWAGETPRNGKGRRRIGIMGGTFDPIHYGHLVAASEVMHAFDLEQVVFVPAAIQPFKQGRRITAAEHRYLMAEIATASNNRFTVSRVDIDRGGVTYTYETLRDLKAAAPDVDWYFITGADALSQILSWKHVDELFASAHFVGVSRPGHELEVPDLPEGAVSLIEVPALAISSSDCRERVAAGKPIWYLVPDGVVQYISKYHLYSE